ncbi:MAG TPA: hypothetical protein VG841_06200 [Caulobacterales bacterium]|nr:hypothetical protein [Caulobacterales bacterium]
MATAGRAKHWTELEERGADWGPSLMAFIYRTLGRTMCRVVMAPVILFFYVMGTRQRRASLDYLRRAWAAQGRTDRPGHWHALRHFFAFGDCLIDKYAAWLGHIVRADVDGTDSAGFEELRRDPRGIAVITAHFGAIEIVRAIATRDHRRRVTIVIHTKHARRYNDLLKRFAPESQVSLVEATDFGVGAAVELAAAVERGEWVVIMGDRMPASRNGRTLTAEFLGAPAAFPQGPFILASALRAPTYMLFCYKAGAKYRVHLSPLSRLEGSRRNRMAELGGLIERYARTLEELVKVAPYQWFNFYEFWAGAASVREEERRGGD